jgi:membrane protein implicated in regulation of membrane protease activity
VNPEIDVGRPRDTGGAVEEPAASTLELLRTAVAQASRLARDEMRQLQAEVTVKVRHLGIAAGLFGGAGVLALYGGAALLTALALLLALVVPAWVSALIVTVALFAMVAILALVGGRRLRRVGPLMPTGAIDSVKADLRAVVGAVKRQRQQRARRVAPK